MTTILINPDSLQAIALAASKEQSRYYLNGVNVELYKDGSYGLIATDGHRLHTLQTKANEALDSSYILSNDDIKKAVSLAKMARKEIGRGLQQLINIQIDAAFILKLSFPVKSLAHLLQHQLTALFQTGGALFHQVRKAARLLWLSMPTTWRILGKLAGCLMALKPPVLR